MTLPPRGNGLALPRGATVLRFPEGKRFSGGDIRGTPLPQGATGLRCPEGQRFCVSPRGNGFPEATFEGHRCPEGQRFCVAPRGNGFPKATFEGHRCDCLPSVGSCMKRGTFLFPEPRSAVGSGFLTRRTRYRATTFVMA